MATSSEYVQSILASLALVTNSEMTEEEMEDVGVIEILVEMDEAAHDLKEVLE